MERSASAKRRSRSSGKSHRGSPEPFARFFDLAQPALIFALIIAAPWLFACTEDWSIRLMNIGCALLGLLGITDFILRRNSQDQISESFREQVAKWSFLGINLALLLFCSIAWLNARANFSITEQAFTYREGVISWLPTSYDSRRTFQFLINSLALFSAFWAVRQWILGGIRSSKASRSSNRRLELLLWVFLVNGFLVALQGLLQRLSGSAELLWFRPAFWPDPAANFGPFSYRGNAVDYLNMVWPITFGFWFYLSEKRGRIFRGFGDGPELVLLPMFLVTLGASYATLSRGGVLVATALVIGLVCRLIFSKTARFWKLALGISLVSVFLLALGLFGEVLKARFRNAFSDQFSGRTEIYTNSYRIAADFPLFGSGPGTFQSIYYLYRESPDQSWAAFAHDDWLETRVTFGNLGYALVLLQFALLFLWALCGRDRWVSPILTFCILLSLAGCLLHAKADFPFQTYGVTFTFVIVSALLITAQAPARREVEPDHAPPPAPSSPKS